MNLKAYTEKKSGRVNKALLRYLDHQKENIQTNILDAMRYSLMAGGKRIRPILCIASAEAVGGEERKAMPAACSLEMIHTYSLIHDDLPALDNDDLRRGKKTCHKQFDEPTAILAGDGLLTTAFEVLTSCGLKSRDKSVNWLSVIHNIAKASGCSGMIEGQMRDMASERKRLGLDHLKEIHQLKTGALIRVSVQTGATIGKGSAKQIKQLLDYGENIGLAFQVTDDILNVKGDACIMGKATGTDCQRDKNTYPTLMGLADSEKYAEELIENALIAIRSFDKKADPLRKIAHYIIQRNK